MFRALIISTILSFCYISGFGQNTAGESIVVKGTIKRTDSRIFEDFYQNLFCFMGGDYNLHNYAFQLLKIDKIIKGNFQEDTKLPLTVKLVLINDVGLLPNYKENNDSFIFHIKQFPNSKVYYSDSIELIKPNEKYLSAVKKAKETFEKTVSILETGRIMQIKNAIDDVSRNYYNYYDDFRYIKYVIPLLNYRGDITYFNITHWDGVDDKGNMIGGTDTIWTTISFSDYMYRYLEKLRIPISIPYERDSKLWSKWYSDISNIDCFPKVDFVSSKYKHILNTDRLYCLQSKHNDNSINFETENEIFKLTNSDSLIRKQIGTVRTMPCKSVIINKKAFTFSGWENLWFGEKSEDVFYLQNKLKIKGMDFGNTERTSIELMKSNSDLIVAWGQNIREQNSLKIGKLSTEGTWLKKPKSIFEYKNTFYSNSRTEISTLASLHLDDGCNLIVFPVVNYNKMETYTIFFKQIDSDLNVLKTNSVEVKFKGYYDKIIQKIYIRKIKDGYLLLCDANKVNIGGYELYYMIVDENFAPKTDFVRLSEYMIKMTEPIIHENKCIISWIDSNVVKSIMVDEEIKQSSTINITDLDAYTLYTNMHNNDSVDFYIFSRENNSLIRKRIDKNEYKF